MATDTRSQTASLAPKPNAFPRVIGTAGHVDHGKSTLIQALTGIDPDRLREEKERGMTIDLGFAWLRLPSGQEVSMVDVPGHERFIKNMLAGIGGIDIALLVIAADEGVMPQTREHLAILDLLDVRRGTVAITKRDLVDEDWLELVTAEIEETLAGTTLEGARLVPVSSTTGEGLDDLRAELDRLLAADRQRRQTGWPRLPVDRVFTMAGFGTVVTGTLIDGELRLGQEVEISPSGRRARIRGLQSHRRRTEVAPAGTRVAVNLSGLAVEDVERGDVLTAPGWLKATRVVDVRLRMVSDALRALAHNSAVTFHTGSAEALARVSLLDHQEMNSGETGWAQIRLDRPLAAVRGDPFVIRLPSPSITIAGGSIVDEHPKRHRRFQGRIFAQLSVLERGAPDEIILDALQRREPAELGELAKRAAHTTDEAVAVVAPLVEAGRVLLLDEARAGWPSNTLLVSAQGWARIEATVLADLRSYHEAHHLRRGMPKEELRKRLDYDARVFTRVERELLARGAVTEDGPFVRLPEFAVVLTPEEETQAEAVTHTLTTAGTSPPSRAEVRVHHHASEELIQAMIDRGDLVEVGMELVYLRSTYDELVAGIKALIRDAGAVTVAQVRDRFGTSRRYVLAILEHLDERRVTRRVGDERVLL